MNKQGKFIAGVIVLLSAYSVGVTMYSGSYIKGNFVKWSTDKMVNGIVYLNTPHGNIDMPDTGKSVNAMPTPKDLKDIELEYPASNSDIIRKILTQQGN